MINIRIKSVYIKNFRCIKDVELICDDLTVLIGKNGSGKSSLLKAIQYFFKVKNVITDEDYFNRETDQAITIKVTFHKLGELEKDVFKRYLNDQDELIVIKIINNSDEKYYGYSKQVKEFSEVRKLSATEVNSRYSQWVDDGKYGFTARVRGADKIKSILLAYEEEHPEELEEIREEHQFMGPSNIGGGSLDNYTKFILIPAMHDTVDDVESKSGPIQELVKMIVKRSSKQREEIDMLTDEFNQKISAIFNSADYNDMDEISNEITDALKLYAPNSEFSVEWGDVLPPRVSFPDPLVQISEDNFSGSIVNKGHGLQRMITLTLLQHLSELTKTEDIEDLIVAIEEPEIYQHPSRSRYLSKVFQKLVEEEDNNTNQLFLTTHSPNFVSIDNFNKIRVIQKKLNGLIIPETVISMFTFEDYKNAKASLDNKSPSEVSIEHVIAKTMPILNSKVSEGFFSKLPILVEGDSDYAVLWTLQSIMKKEWEKLDVVIISMGGKSKLDRPYLIFNGFNLKTYFIFDGDFKLGTTNSSENKENRKFMRMGNESERDYPDSQIFEKFTVFKENLELEMNNELGDEVFNLIFNRVKRKLELKKKNMLKNMYAASMFVEEVYKEGYNLPFIEKVVEKISDLAEKNS